MWGWTSGLDVGAADPVNEQEDRMIEAEVQVSARTSDLGRRWCPSLDEETLRSAGGAGSLGRRRAGVQRVKGGVPRAPSRGSPGWSQADSPVAPHSAVVPTPASPSSSGVQPEARRGASLGRRMIPGCSDEPGHLDLFCLHISSPLCLGRFLCSAHAPSRTGSRVSFILPEVQVPVI